ncbi:MAG: glycosyltransferase [Gammaproteobacteria bacterium]
MAGWSQYVSEAVALLWLLTLSMPWQAWRTREVLEADAAGGGCDLSAVTVVIPARNEAAVIETTLAALVKQGQGLKIVLVDDDSDDGTGDLGRRMGLTGLTVVEAEPLPAGWSGKLWAQEQGLARVGTPLTLLLDADIELTPGMLKALLAKKAEDDLHFVSLMAQLRFGSFWEKLLMPAFIHFFKMIYPFALANKPGSPVAAAAGGCILVDTDVLRIIGGMATLKDAVIDDCTLARKVKTGGFKTWIGLTHGVLSQRPYVALSEIWSMVARTAYTQLGYSVALLMLCTIAMIALYWLPLFGALAFDGVSALYCAASFFAVALSHLPVLRFYRFNPVWSLAMPFIAGLFLAMTWTSARRYWRGERSRWKGRVYTNLGA